MSSLPLLSNPKLQRVVSSLLVDGDQRPLCFGVVAACWYKSSLFKLTGPVNVDVAVLG